MAEFSPIITTLKPRRTRVSSFTFLNRPQEQQPREDFGTTLALQQNRLAFDNINSSLVNLTNQVTALSASLDGIAQRVREDSALDQAREAQKRRQEEILAEQKLREGKESVVERKMQSALLTPVRKIGNKARFTLGRLANFFMILLAGFLGNMALSTISALISGDKERLEELKQKFLKNIGVVGGIFLLFSGGLTTILGYLTRLGARLGSAVFRNLLIRPVNALINLVKEGVKGVARGLGLAPKAAPKAPPAKPAPPKAPPAAKPGGGKPGGAAPPAKTTKPGGGLKGFGKSVGKQGLFSLGFSTAIDLAFGESIGSSLAGGFGAAAPASLFAGLAYIAPKNLLFQLPIGVGALISSYLGYKGGRNFYSENVKTDPESWLNTSFDLRNLFNEKPVIQRPKGSGDNLQSLKEPDTGGNVTVINNESTASAGNVQKNKNLGSANYLPSIPTAPDDNFYITSSQLVYNAGWA